MPAYASEDIERLRTQIAQIEKRPVLMSHGTGPGSHADAQAGLVEVLAASAGILHEVFVDEERQAGAGLGATLGIAKRLLKGERRAILYLQLVKQAQELGLPYGLGLNGFGLDPDTLVIGRIENITELLWAMEEAIACRAVAAVIADVGGSPAELDFTTTRRLSLRAAASGTSAFLLRYGLGREASAARLRWHVSARVSGEGPFDPRAPGTPRFLIEIEKGRLEGRRLEGLRFVVDWMENEFASVDPRQRRGVRVRRSPPVPGAFSPALGDGLSQAS